MQHRAASPTSLSLILLTKKSSQRLNRSPTVAGITISSLSKTRLLSACQRASHPSSPPLFSGQLLPFVIIESLLLPNLFLGCLASTCHFTEPRHPSLIPSNLQWTPSSTLGRCFLLFQKGKKQNKKKTSHYRSRGSLILLTTPAFALPLEHRNPYLLLIVTAAVVSVALFLLSLCCISQVSPEGGRPHAAASCMDDARSGAETAMRQNEAKRTW